MNTRLICRFIALLLLLVGSRARAQDRPNIVMIISDDQAWTDYGFMGHEHIRTPAIDELASQSLTFTRGYVPDSLCRPSLATMVTGLYPHQHRIVGNDPPGHGEPGYLQRRIAYLDHITNVPTLPRLLAEEGYLSHQSGKWWEGSYQHGGFTHGMTHGDRTRGGRHGDQGLAIGRQGLDPIYEFIEMAQEEEQPFFIWYAPFLPHTPHNPPQELFEYYRPLAPSPSVARYWAMCEWFDQTCGELLTHLDEQGLAENTLVVYVCDNGWIQRENGRGFAPRSKRSQYDGGTRTPIMFRWPGHIEPRTDDANLCSSIDLAPTILTAVGLEPTDAMQGINMMDRDAVVARDAIFGEIFEHDAQHMTDPAASLRWRWVVEGDWKLITPEVRQPNDPVELYNLAEDPFEENNLAAQHPERVEHLRGLLDAWWTPVAEDDETEDE